LARQLLRSRTKCLRSAMSYESVGMQSQGTTLSVATMHQKVTKARQKRKPNEIQPLNLLEVDDVEVDVEDDEGNAINAVKPRQNRIRDPSIRLSASRRHRSTWQAHQSPLSASNAILNLGNHPSESPRQRMQPT